MPDLSKHAPLVLSLLRIIAGLMLMQHGLQKHFDFPAPFPMGDLPAWSQLWIGGWLEIILGALVALGLFTRIAAFLAAGMMAVAYFQFHAASGFWPIVNQGELAALYCWVFFYVVFSGPGSLSLDAVLRKRG